MPKEFFIDEDAGRFVRSFTDTTAESPGNLFRGDIRDARLYFLRQTGVFGRPYRTVDRSGVDSLSFAIGDILSEPTGGTFTLTYDSLTTAAIAYNATAAQVESAFIGAIGEDVTVEKVGNTLFVLTFDELGVRTAITGSAAGLTPLSGLFINVRTTGTASVKEVVTIELAVAPAALSTSFAAIDTTVTATPSQLIAGDATSNEVQRIIFSQAPALGTFAIRIPEYTRAATAAVVGGVFITTTNHGASVGQPVIFSDYDTPVNVVNGQRYFIAEIVSATAFRVSLAQFGAAITNATADASTATVTFPGGQTDRIDYDADGQEIAEAFELLEQIGVGNASVTRLSETEIVIAFRGQKSFSVIPLLQVENFLEGLAGLAGSLNLSTERIRELLAIATQIELTAEVQILDDGKVETVAQSAAIISRDLIVGSSIAPQLGFSIVPITAGGTGETTAAGARTALGVFSAESYSSAPVTGADVTVNYNETELGLLYVLIKPAGTLAALNVILPEFDSDFIGEIVVHFSQAITALDLTSDGEASGNIYSGAATAGQTFRFFYEQGVAGALRLQ